MPWALDNGLKLSQEFRLGTGIRKKLEKHSQTSAGEFSKSVIYRDPNLHPDPQNFSKVDLTPILEKLKCFLRNFLT